jgi:hypothetical protein
MYNNYLFGQGFIFYTFVFMSIRSVIFVCSLMAFCKVFSQSIQWESAINLDPLSVTILDCSGQKWDSLPFEIFQFTNLKELDLSKNKLSPRHDLGAKNRQNRSKNRFFIAVVKHSSLLETNLPPVCLPACLPVYHLPAACPPPA